MSTKKRVAAVLITTVAISAGTVGIASADAKSKTNRVSVASSTMKGPRGLDLAATLSALVAKGTITQAQADAVLAAANAARAAADAMRPAKPDHAARLALIATTIGVPITTTHVPSANFIIERTITVKIEIMAVSAWSNTLKFTFFDESRNDLLVIPELVRLKPMKTDNA